VLVLEGGAEHDDPCFGERRPQVDALADRGDTQCRRAGLERRRGDGLRAVAVAVGLDDGPELGPREGLAQSGEVRPQRCPVDGDLRPLRPVIGVRACVDARRLRTSCAGARRSLARPGPLWWLRRAGHV
jgi:hypothetical protein